MKKLLFTIGGIAAVAFAFNLYIKENDIAGSTTVNIADRNQREANKLSTKLPKPNGEVLPIGQNLPDAENTEMVFGLSVQKDRTCTLVERYIEQDDGSLMRGVDCIPAEKPSGPYELLSDETLMEMTYAEAGAAAELAKRWAYDHPEEARMLALRAVALDSSNVKPIETLAWDQYSQDYDENGIATEFVQETYVLLRTAEVIKGGSMLDVDHSRDLLLKAGYTDEQMAGLEQRVDMEVSFIQNTQIEMTGATNIARTEQ